MKSFMQLVVGHPYMVLLASGLLERVGAPLLFSPVLVAAGALAAGGHLRFDVAVWIALATCVAGRYVMVRDWPEKRRSRSFHALPHLPGAG